MTAIPKIKPELYRWEDALIASDVSLHARLTGLILRRYMNRDLQAWPAHATLAREAGMSERKLRQALAELKNAGLLTWRKLGYGKQNKYAGRFPIPEPAPTESGTPCRIEDAQSGTPCRINPAHHAEKLPNELLKNPPLPLPRREKRGGSAPAQTRTRIPRGPRPERLAAKAPSDAAIALVMELSQRNEAIDHG